MHSPIHAYEIQMVSERRRKKTTTDQVERKNKQHIQLGGDLMPYKIPLHEHMKCIGIDISIKDLRGSFFVLYTYDTHTPHTRFNNNYARVLATSTMCICVW